VASYSQKPMLMLRRWRKSQLRGELAAGKEQIVEDIVKSPAIEDGDGSGGDIEPIPVRRSGSATQGARITSCVPGGRRI
jgi:hypothetical protein